MILLASQALLSIPVEPGADEARRWAEQELSKADYRQGASLADRIAQWLSDVLNNLLSSDGGGGLTPLGYVLALLVVAALIGAAIAIARPLLARRRTERADVLAGEARSASELEAAAQAAASRALWREAVVDRFRAIVRSAEERALIDPRPGRTADEASADTAAVVPAVAHELRLAARVFDEVRYSDRPATESDYAAVSQAADALASARRAPTSVPTPTGPSA
ncbi:DUF4129 domain-containing protein [Demequina capsici]|uniref:DUF4129 domain-containing protein n=1 Tax=Demequina capsici TaxID=3075620 RepID=A0AA96F8W8_9MICO|nr:DUF4129 domain-containing protein [Demequina sp. OYTSA14]WNM23870.1 DUF4129 domain-containing protein [Demequina sp. OYTSA14]